MSLPDQGHSSSDDDSYPSEAEEDHVGNAASATTTTAAGGGMSLDHANGAAGEPPWAEVHAATAGGQAVTAALQDVLVLGPAALATTTTMAASRGGNAAAAGAGVGVLGGSAGEVSHDESGALVEQRFVQFLGSYCERVPRLRHRLDDHHMIDDVDNNHDDDDQFVYPYVEQANQMARRQLARRALRPTEDDAANLPNDFDNDDDMQLHLRASPFANTLFLDFAHVVKADPELAEAMQTDFIRFEPYLRSAIRHFVWELHPTLQQQPNNASSAMTALQSYFLAVHNLPTVVPIRQLRTDQVGRLAAVSGTVTRTSEVRPELLQGAFRCQLCGLLVSPRVVQQYHYTRPTVCRNPRCQNTLPQNFVLEAAQSEFCDWQKLRVQENAHEIPPGSMPRSMDVYVRNEMVERAAAGDKCVFTGSLVVIPDGSALARAGEAPRAATVGGGTRQDAAAGGGGGGGVRGLKALGVKELTYRTCFVAHTVLSTDALTRIATTAGSSQFSSTAQQPYRSSAHLAHLLFGTQYLENHEPTTEEVVMEFTQEERQDIRAMKSDPALYNNIASSVAPNTFGHMEIKKGILLMLLGGVHKTTPDGIPLRGDINVCVVGDPSTAKSQFLKFVHAFLPSRVIYTSGKASSAAGLTAAVQRDADTGEYCIEAGALMLADNGICCIDEFDKMDPNDQVAIHEAMEQQTISITKAGIQATLNARASILAAANPVHGRYDRTKTLRANVALSAPILSRFDLFFVVLDECNPDADRRVAQHILNVHRGLAGDDMMVTMVSSEEQTNSSHREITISRPFYSKEQMQRYIRFARTINPRLTETSQRVLVDCYRQLRQGDTLGRSRSAYRVTVRQLESMIRLSEALARLHCHTEIQPSYVREAFRLLKTSIIQVESGDVDMEDDDDVDQGDDHPEGGAMEQDDDPLDGANNPETQERHIEHHYHPGEYQPLEHAKLPPRPESDLDGGTNAHLDSDPKQDDRNSHMDAEDGAKKKSKNKKTTKISFEEYEAMAAAIATQLRSLEDDQENINGDMGDDDGFAKPPSTNWRWSQVVDWYLQTHMPPGASEQQMESERRKVNLVIRRLWQVESVLVTVGPQPRNKQEEQQSQLRVHPNYALS